MSGKKKDTKSKTTETKQSFEPDGVSQEVPTISLKDMPFGASNSTPNQNMPSNPKSSTPNSAKHPSPAPTSKKGRNPNSDIPSVDAKSVPSALTGESGAIDALVRQNTIDSDKDYRTITKEIIQNIGDQLTAHTTAKNPLRLKLLWFVIILLSAEFIALVLILFFNTCWKLGISDFIVNVYVISLFLETLAGLMIMINFSFDSKQEIQLIKVLHAIIRHFKKFDDK